MKRELIVNPCTRMEYTYGSRKKEVQVFCKIVFDNGRLSITGVVGPTSNGNCCGAGQCTEEIRTGTPTKEWTKEMLEKFCDIWYEWHLNDMRPYCKHMKQMGWDKEAMESVEIKTYTLNSEGMRKKKEAEARALKCLHQHEGFFPTWDETICSTLPYEQKIYNGSGVDRPEYYNFKEKNCLGHSNIEYKIRGHINYSENELGLLGSKCPICGYKYGHGWLKEEIPQDVIDFLTNLPKSNKVPAWI